MWTSVLSSSISVPLVGLYPGLEAGMTMTFLTSRRSIPIINTSVAKMMQVRVVSNDGYDIGTV